MFIFGQSGTKGVLKCDCNSLKLPKSTIEEMHSHTFTHRLILNGHSLM